MQTVKPVLSCLADSLEASNLDVQNAPGVLTDNEGSRKVRTSAAMIGLAISVGASALLLPKQHEPVMAAEPVPSESSLANVTPNSENPQPVPQPEVVIQPTPSLANPIRVSETNVVTPLIKHEVKEGESLWQLSQEYQISPEAIAASNDITPRANLLIGQTLKIPATNGIVHPIRANETVESLAKSYGVKPSQIKASKTVSLSEALPMGESVTVAGDIDRLLEQRQQASLRTLKDQQEKLQASLSQLKNRHTVVAAVPDETPTHSPTESTSLAVPKLEAPRPIVAASPNLQSTPAIEIPVIAPETGKLSNSQTSIQPQSPALEPLTVPSPETAIAPTPAQPTLLNEPVSQPTTTPKTSVVTPTTSRPSGTILKSPVSLPAPTPNKSMLPSQVEPSTTQSNRPVVIPVAVPQTATVTAPISSPEIVTTVTPQSNPLQPSGITAANSSSQTYRVQQGDTLNAIARRYGISRTELARANNISNPNLIKINQPLIIPQKAYLAQNRTQTNISPVNLKQTPLVNQPQIASTTLPLASVSSSNLNNWSQANNPSPVTSIQSSVNPHLEKLEADLGKLQQNVPHQPNSSSQTIPIAVEPVVAQVSNPTPVESESVNPEWVNRSNANPKSLSVQPKENFPQSGQHRTVGIGNNNPSVNSSQSQSQLVGSIPIPVENYNPMLRTPVGESVGPDLPSLSAPDQFLPNTPSQFTGYQWPAKGVLTSGYGPRWGRMHKGIDIAAPVGTPITASASGEVISAGWNNGGYGNLVKIRHADGSVTLYAHNSRILVRPGQIVEQGQLISEMGSTGFSTGPHLHFEIHPSGKGAVNPIAFLPRNRS